MKILTNRILENILENINESMKSTLPTRDIIKLNAE